MPDCKLKEEQNKGRFSEGLTHTSRTLYIQKQGAVLKKQGNRLYIKDHDETIFEVPAIRVEQVVIFGNCNITMPAMKLCLKEGIPVYLLSSHGDYKGMLVSENTKRLFVVREQFLKCSDMEYCLEMAKEIVLAKIHNQRVLMQRNKENCPEIIKNIKLLQLLKKRVEHSDNMGSLRGIEGAAQACFFNAFRYLLQGKMVFAKRTRRPPKDPVNSLLSFGYTILFQNVYSFLRIHGLDPYCGFLHKNIRNNPALASDLMEEFRTPVVDSLILFLVKSGIIKNDDFYIYDDNCACILKDEARIIFVKHFEDKLHTEHVDPLSGSKFDYRRYIDRQAGRIVRSIIDDCFKYNAFRINY